VNRHRYHRLRVSAIIGPWSYRRCWYFLIVSSNECVAFSRCAQRRTLVSTHSFEKPHEARIDFADRADELHDAFGLAFPAFRRFENLPYAPAHVGFDSLLEECLPRELRIEIG
jgi:hypothetical protein